jgi:hypothetical protein
MDDVHIILTYFKGGYSCVQNKLGFMIKNKITVYRNDIQNKIGMIYHKKCIHNSCDKRRMFKYHTTKNLHLDITDHQLSVLLKLIPLLLKAVYL